MLCWHGLPVASYFAGSPRSVCFDFRHMQRASQGECPPERRDSSQFYFAVDIRRHCPTQFWYLRQATEAAVAYANVQPSAKACHLRNWRLDVAFTLVAHVRSGDIFESGSHAEYGQPPLTFYLKAWEHSGLPRLLMIAKDAQNPVVQVARQLQGHITRWTASASRLHSLEVQHSSWEEDLGTLLCAQHVVLSRSSINTLLLTSPNLHSAYAPTVPRADVWTGSCQTKYFATAAPYAKKWMGSDAQLLDLVVAPWNGTGVRELAFRRHRVGCLWNHTAKVRRKEMFWGKGSKPGEHMKERRYSAH